MADPGGGAQSGAPRKIWSTMHFSVPFCNTSVLKNHENKAHIARERNEQTFMSFQGPLKGHIETPAKSGHAAFRDTILRPPHEYPGSAPVMWLISQSCPKLCDVIEWNWQACLLNNIYRGEMWNFMSFIKH